ncbi:MAG: acyl carrier protein [Candidatus Marinimicrobia bacterium]|nr:acyl carrier protein [Candidatus Neomarinimicrobiota bacterium]
MSNTSAKISDLIADKLGVDPAKITEEAKFVEDLGADSLDTVELIMQLEDEFSLEIPDEDAEKLLTVGAVIEYIDSHS